MKRNEVLQSNDLVLSAHDMTRNQLVAFKGIISEYVSGDVVEIDVNKMAELLGMGDDRNRMNRVFDMMEEMQRTALVKFKTAKKRTSTVVIPHIQWSAEKAYIIETHLHPNAVVLIQNLKKGFTHYFLETISQLRSQYSVRLYELMRMKLYRPRVEGTFSISVDDLRDFLYLENKYSSWRDFKRDVLDKGIGEINLHTDLEVEYELDRGVRNKVIGLIFTVFDKEEFETQLLIKMRKHVHGDDDVAVPPKGQLGLQFDDESD